VASCIVDIGAIYIIVVKFRNTIWPPPPQLSLHRRAALSSNSNGKGAVYSRENPKSSLYCEMSMDWTYVCVQHRDTKVSFRISYLWEQLMLLPGEVYNISICYCHIYHVPAFTNTFRPWTLRSWSLWTLKNIRSWVFAFVPRQSIQHHGTVDAEL
jgi:hypothetical protein